MVLPGEVADPRPAKYPNRRVVASILAHSFSRTPHVFERISATKGQAGEVFEAV
jgi:UDP-N-acetylmuramate-alanine ligase